MRDIQLKDVKALFTEAVEVLDALRLKPGMHHISWKTLSTELKLKVDSTLRRFVVLAQDAAGVSAARIVFFMCPLFLMLLNVAARSFEQLRRLTNILANPCCSQSFV